MMCADNLPLIKRQRLALIEALSRYGYTFIDFRAGHPHRDDWYERMYPAESKPYYVYIGLDNSLIILHEDCTDCWRRDLVHHERDFLHELIPVIGRLDAFAKYDDGRQEYGWAPRLLIQL